MTRDGSFSPGCYRGRRTRSFAALRMTYEAQHEHRPIYCMSTGSFAALRMTRLSNLGGCVSPSIMNINTISAQVQNIYQSAFTVQPHYPVERSKNYRKMSSNEQTSTT